MYCNVLKSLSKRFNLKHIAYNCRPHLYYSTAIDLPRQTYNSWLFMHEVNKVNEKSVYM
jgi:hypothetical protein